MNTNIKATSSQPSLPTAELWRALLIVFNHYLVWEVGLARMRVAAGEIPKEAADAVRVLDWWLDRAINNGWLDEDTPAD